MEEVRNIDIIMLSNLNKNEGGRETWLYNFLPELFTDGFFTNVNLVGLKTPAEKDNTEELKSLHKSAHNTVNFTITIFNILKSRIPRAFVLFKELKAFKQDHLGPSDFVLAMGIFEMVIIYNIKRFRKAKKIIWLRSIFVDEKAYVIPNFLRGFFLKFEIAQLRRADILLCNGDDIRDFYSTYGLNLYVIKNGVDTKKWQVPSPELKKPIKVAYVGRLSQVKGIEDYFRLIEVIKSGKYASEFEFHIVGQSYSYFNTVERLAIQNYIINHNVIPNDELPKFLKSIDVCVALTYASHTGGGGGTSNAMLEQMASSRIMLAWDNVIFRQYLNERNSYLAQQYSIDDLEKQLIKILHNKDEALSKAKQSKETVKDYTFKANYQNFKKTLKSSIK